MVYNPTTWVPGVFGTEITSARLNNLENGLSKAHSGIGVIHTGGTSKADVIATLDAAEALGKGTVAMFPAATYDVGTGLSLNGYSCQIRGQGAAMLNTTTPTGTVFYASSQTGPVLDFKGWLYPDQFSGRVRHGDFAVLGSGVADATKANIGIRVDLCMSTTFADIAIMGTGGPCLKITCDTAGLACYLCDFERITLRAPISTGANDVPYFYAKEANGNRFCGLGFISRLSTGDTGVSGAAVIEGSASYPSHDNKFDAWWFENLHVPTNGCLVSHSGNTNIFDAFQFFDIKRETSATNTTHYRLLPTLVSDSGGNEIRGLIPGDNNGGGTVPQYGVDVQQSGNSITGVKGYRGNNVVLASGVERCFVHLRGSQSNGGTAGVVDNSGMATNTIIDAPMGTHKFAAAATANAVLDIGGGVTIRAGSGDPNSVVPANPGSVFLRTDAVSGTAIYVKDGGTGSTGWVPRTADSYLTATIASNFAVNCSSTHAWNLTLQGSYTMTGFSNGRVGQTQILMFTQDATGSRTVTWPATIKWAGGTAPTLSTAAGKTDVFQFVLCGDGYWRELSRTIGA
jgi:hypothetical protein